MLPARWLCRIKGPAPAGCQRVHDDRVRRRPRRTPRVQPGRHGPRLYGHYARALDEGPAPRSAKSSPPPATSCDIRPGPASRLSASTRSPPPRPWPRSPGVPSSATAAAISSPLYSRNRSAKSRHHH